MLMNLDFQSVSAIVFVLFLSVFVFLKRKNLTVQKIFFPIIYFAMYKTKLGLKAMDKMAKHKKTIRFFGIIGVIIGFLGMGFICFALIQTLIKSIITQQAIQGAGLVLPFKVKGSFYVPFFYWIICIFVLAIVHEFAHGVVARANNIKIKSSGFAFLAVLVPVLPAAFVEPDEDELKKSSKIKQLMVYAAGPFANFMLAAIVLGLTVLIFTPLSASMVAYDGILVDSVMDGYPALEAGIEGGQIIRGVDGIEIKTQEEFTSALADKMAGESVIINSDNSDYNVTLAENPDNSTKGYLGVYIKQNTKIDEEFTSKYGTLTPSILMWIFGLFSWMYLLNLGIGLFNLLPLGPVDGGRMLKTGLLFFCTEKRADTIWKIVSFIFLALILFNVFGGFF